jgi:hypothetical protein
MEEKKTTTRKRYVYLDKFDGYKSKVDNDIEKLQRKVQILVEIIIISWVITVISVVVYNIFG